MSLIEEWKSVIRKAWSVRLALISAALSALEFGLQYAAPEHSSGKFAAIAGLVSMAAAVSRVIAQPSLHKEEK